MVFSQLSLQEKQTVLQLKEKEKFRPVLAETKNHDESSYNSQPSFGDIRIQYRTVSANSDVVQYGRHKRKRSPSPFMIFNIEQRPKLKEANPGLSFGEIAKMIGAMWKGMSEDEKEPYYKMALDEKQSLKYSDDDSDDEYIEHIKSSRTNRLRYMGSTPSKTSLIGRAVIKRMVDDESDDDDTVLFPDLSNPDNIWLMTGYGEKKLFSLDDPDDATHLDMGHLYSAVDFWNRIGRYTGMKSSCVTNFMRDTNNYRIQLGRRNCQTAPHVTYQPVASQINPDFKYIPCSTPGSTSNFDEMIEELKRQGLRK